MASGAGNGVGDRRGYLLGVDVGGTFTDLVLASTDGGYRTHKVATTPDDPRQGVVTGIDSLLARTGVAGHEVRRLVHGTTLATNVILERRGPPVAFVTTLGFGDMLRMGREARVGEDRFDLFFTTPVPPVSRAMTFEVAERVDAAGRVVAPLDERALDSVVEELRRLRPDGVAICLLHAYANPEHEQRVARRCAEALPSSYVVASNDVWPEMREYERAMTAVMCAYVGPVMAGYLEGLASQLRDLGIACPLEVMESSGGVMSAALAARLPIYSIESGGAAGVVAAGYVGHLLEAPEVISFDMGGTTAKTGIVRGGRPDVSHDFVVGGHASHGGARGGGGFPVKVPVVDMVEVGAGGGSIAWVDTGGALRVGPRSAGSDPGPACYGRGGRAPTVTDANLLLGYLSPGSLAGGIELSPRLAEEAVGRAVAGPLGLDLTDAAWGIHEIANANMAAAIRMVTIQRGIDPRGTTLVGFGGAGPMHAMRLASMFGIRTVAVPWAAGVASAVGLVATDPRVEAVTTNVMDEHDLDPSTIEDIFAGLAARARTDLGVTEADDRVTTERAVDVRYRGQAYELTVPLGAGPVGADSVPALVAGFKALYLETYGIDLDAPIQAVSFRLTATREVDKLRPVPADPEGTRRPEPGGWRAVYQAGAGFVEVPVHRWDDLRPGDELSGPAIVEGAETTVVVPPGGHGLTDRWRNLVLRSA